MVFRPKGFRLEPWRFKKRPIKFLVFERPTVPNDKVYPQIPFLIRSKKYCIKTRADNTPEGQLYNQTFSVTDLFRDERIVLNYNKACEIRPQVERLIVEAMRYGDRHRPTMDLANFWLRDKSLIHKLFKVFVPRYENYPTAFTALHMLGCDYAFNGMPFSDRVKERKANVSKGEAVLEMRGNPLPPIIRPKVNRSGLLTNLLIDGARESLCEGPQGG